MAPAKTLLFCALLSLLVLILPSPSAANEANILRTGDVLLANGQLSVPGAALVMQDDCNLVLYNEGSGFISGTSGRATNCTLTLSELGQLIIKNSTGGIIWYSPVTGKLGSYAAILRPDGQVSIYGPSYWTAVAPHTTGTTTSAARNIKAKAAGFDQLWSTPQSAPNLLFSSQVLLGDNKLESRDYTFAVTESCNLALTKAPKDLLWESGVGYKGRPQHCFARLNYFGQLSIVDDLYTVVWNSSPEGVEGEYVLAVQIDGQATIYGPKIWSTGSS
ncbi:Mannose-specific lectin 1 [Apostasia shenzhenica]|uniref:Mannose-specific lectin 1 n=1 Tax=Apostasia shenzhenica TaxID=1088818 RepID=A0A2H9ZZ56_9ASPA|nr:Mannose-specific lectin 1 [Apostasia shenzhenica]